MCSTCDFERLQGAKMCQAPSSPCHVQVQSSSCSFRATPRLRLGELFEAQGVCMVSSPTQRSQGTIEFVLNLRSSVVSSLQK